MTQYENKRGFVMKYILAIFVTLFLAACSTNTDNQVNENVEAENTETIVVEKDSNLIDFETVNENFWISYGGSESEDEKMLYTEPISYDSNKNYSMNIDGYISYYKDDEFLETILHIEDKPQQIDTIVGANNIVLSFKKSFDNAELIEVD